MMDAEKIELPIKMLIFAYERVLLACYKQQCHLQVIFYAYIISDIWFHRCSYRYLDFNSSTLLARKYAGNTNACDALYNNIIDTLE